MRKRIEKILIVGIVLGIGIVAVGANASESRFNEAAELYEQGRWQDAAIAFTEAVETLSDEEQQAASHFYLGECLMQLEEFSKAREHYRLVLKQTAAGPYAQRAQFRAGEASWFAGDAPTAELELLQFVKKYPHDALATRALTYLEGGKVLDEAVGLERDGRYDAAFAAYSELLRQYSKGRIHAETLRRAARLHRQLAQYSEARRLYQKFLDQYATSVHVAEVIGAQAWIDVQTGKHDSAAAGFQNLYKNFPQSAQALEAAYWLALAAADKKERGKATSYVDWLLDELPKKTELSKETESRLETLWEQALLLKCQLSAEGDQWQEIQELLTQSGEGIAKGPRKERAKFWLAEAEFRIGRFDEARAALDRLVDSTVAMDEPWVAMIPLRRAQLRSRRQQWTEVLKILDPFERKYRDFPLQYEVDYLRGRAYAGRGEMTAARRAYHQVLESETATKTETAARAQWMIGETFFHQHDYPRARQAYLKVIDEHSRPEWQARAALQAGKCWELQQNWQEATALYTLALKQWQGTESAGQLQARLKWADRLATQRQ